MQAVILAGGLGTRLRPLTTSIPKPMVEVNGKPFLKYELRLLKKNGITNFVVCVGYKAQVIENYFGDGSNFGISIAYRRDGERQLGPAGAIKNASDLLESEFLVTYGDAFLQMDYGRLIAEFHSHGKLGMMTVFENHNEFGKSDIEVQNGLVTNYDKKGASRNMIWINFGVVLLRKKALDLIPSGIEVGEEQFYRKLIAKGELAAFSTGMRFHEIGTVQGLKEFEEFISKNPEVLSD